jgi:hypothetical protein
VKAMLSEKDERLIEKVSSSSHSFFGFDLAINRRRRSLN